MVDWKLISQGKKTQINKYNTHENNKRFDNNYKIGDTFMLDNDATKKLKTPYRGPFLITECRTKALLV